MRQSESGNVFFYLFICIVLLAALSYAIAQGGRSTVTTLTSERQELLATDIIGYADTVAKAVSQLRLRGSQITELSFANPFISAGEYGTYDNDPANEIFNPAGGAVVYQDPPSDATATGTEQYMFLADNEIQNIGTTCGNNSCTDLLMVVDNVNEAVCQRINDLLDVTDSGDPPPSDTAIDRTGKFAPSANPFGYSETISDEDSALAGHKEACFTETSPDPDVYVYYRVLLTR